MELLKDPGNTRKIKEVPLPPSQPLKNDVLFQKGKIQIPLLKDFLRKEGRLSFADFKRVVSEAMHVFSTPHPKQSLSPT